MNKLPPDPFFYKEYSKYNPKRVFFTVYARLQEIYSRLFYSRWNVEERPMPLDGSHGYSKSLIRYSYDDTAVTADQMLVLLCCVAETELLGGAIVEVGAYRGVTTSILASKTKRKYFAIDPYIGYGGADKDFEFFLNNIQKLSNVEHVKLTSGQAVTGLQGTDISFCFIDAVHDYVNASYDAMAWGQLILPEGLVAFHDTDTVKFPGVQRVVKMLLTRQDYELFCHVSGLTVLRKVA